MHDEALPSYQHIIMNLNVGLKFLKQTLGVRPDIGWSIDPFGSQRTTATVLKAFGFDGYVFNRVSWKIKDQMSRKYGFTFEYMTHGVSDDKTGILCHVLEYHYGMTLDWRNFKWAQDLNQLWQLEILSAIHGEEAMGEKKDMNIIMPLGDDFTFKDAIGTFGSWEAKI